MSGDITGHRVNQMDGKKRKRASLSTEQYEAVLHIISKHDCVSKAERMSARKPKHVHVIFWISVLFLSASN